MKGSYQVLTSFKELIEQNQLSDKITLKASFCMGRCTSGISVTWDGQLLENVGFSNAREIFMTEILPTACG